MNRDEIVKALVALVQDKAKAMAEAAKPEPAKAETSVLEELVKALGDPKPEPTPEPQQRSQVVQGQTYTLEQLKEALVKAQPKPEVEEKTGEPDPLAALSAALSGTSVSNGGYTEEQVGRMTVDQINGAWDKIAQSIER